MPEVAVMRVAIVNAPLVSARYQRGIGHASAGPVGPVAATSTSTSQDMSILHHLGSGSCRPDGPEAWSSSRIVRLSASYRRPPTPPAVKLPEPLVGLGRRTRPLHP